MKANSAARWVSNLRPRIAGLALVLAQSLAVILPAPAATGQAQVGPPEVEALFAQISAKLQKSKDPENALTDELKQLDVLSAKYKDTKDVLVQLLFVKIVLYKEVLNDSEKGGPAALEGLLRDFPDSEALKALARRVTFGDLRLRPNISASLWALSSGKRIQTFQGHNRPVTAVAFSPDGSNILTASVTQELRLWEPLTGKQVGTFQAGPPGWAQTLMFSPDGRYFVLIREGEPKLSQGDAKTGEILRTFEPSSGVGTVVFLASGLKVLVAGELKASVTEWEMTTGKQTRQFAEQSWQGYSRVTLTADGKPRSWWDSETGASLPGEPQVPSPPLGDGNCRATVTPDAKRVFTWGMAGWASRLWDLETGKLIWFSREVSSRLDQVVFSPDGRTFVTTSHEGGARLWDATTGALIRSVGTEKESFSRVAFSPDGKTLLTLTQDRDGVVSLWNVSTGEATQSFPVRVMRCLAFSPDGSKLVAGEDGEFAGL